MNVAQASANKQASREEIASHPLDKVTKEQRQELFHIFLLAFHKAKHFFFWKIFLY